MGVEGLVDTSHYPRIFANKKSQPQHCRDWRQIKVFVGSGGRI